MDTCPYGAIYWNEEAQVPQKCTGCAHLIDEGWTETRCSQVCPTDAIKLVLAEDAEMAEKAEAEGLQAYQADSGHLPPGLLQEPPPLDEGLPGRRASSTRTRMSAPKGSKPPWPPPARPSGEGLTNNYGDFVVDELEPQGTYTLTLSAPGYKPLTREVTLAASLNLGQLFLEKA